ncbi:hypothetical protein [Pseudomonas sp. ES3-33]|uniref:hypothetical protein n=1 Tax=Pseudomonas sp. ES3-33 TaxID=1628833 RepID=UPI0005D3805B|nr:hypothetical protein [Pseudomonas sp. ES3-33]KJH76262.1 hypothetical protein UB23_14855 [Pseudomonas sp. ES3-33]
MLRPIRALRTLGRLITRGVLLVLLCSAFGVQADQVIGRFNSVAGPFSHMETPAGQAYLSLHERKMQVQLPDDWRESTVETTMELDGDTAVVMSYRTAQCDSQTALIVISGKTVWGPYRLGSCGDMLAFQRSEDGKSFVAMQMNDRRSEAWTYSSKDKNFRGPMKVDLPGLLQGLSKARPAVAAAPAPAPAPRPPVAAKPAPVPTTAATPVATARTKPSAPPAPNPKVTVPAPVPKPAPKPPAKVPIPSQLPQPVADAVVKHAQATTPPRRRVEINLISRMETES